MTREELKEHCLKQIENCEMWAKFHGEQPHGKVYEEHKLILELLDPEPCDSCISRQAVLDGLSSIAKAKAKSDSQKALMGRVMFFTKQLPPVTPQPKWIPVSENPKEEGCYMTTLDYGEYGLSAGQRYYHGEDYGWSDVCVIAWMLLPEPYVPEINVGNGTESGAEE